MGNVPVCNCLVNISKDKEGGNFYLNEEENKKENSKMKNNKINNNNNDINIKIIIKFCIFEPFEEVG